MQSITLKINVLLLFVVFAFLSCSSSGGQGTNTPLKNTRWLLRSLNDKKVMIPEGGREAYVFFKSDENKVNGSGGCNNFFGQYTKSKSNLKMGPIARTEMFCEGIMDTEDNFMKALEATVKYKITGNALYFYDAAGKTIARLEASSME